MEPSINEIDHLIARPEKVAQEENPVAQIEPSMSQTASLGFRPGGFWMRFWAWLFDATVLGVVLVGVDYLVQRAFDFGVISFALSLIERGLFGSYLGAMFGTFLLIGAAFLGGLASILVSWILSQLIGWLYYAIFEVGPMHGTPGKLLFGLQVLGKNDAPISFVRSTARHFFKFVGLVPFLFFTVLALGLAVDVDSGRVNKVPEIVKSLFIASLFLTPFFFLIFYAMAGWTKKRRALHDILSGCYVVKAKELSALRVLGTILGVLMTILIALLFVFITWVATHSSVSVSKNSVSIKSPPNYEDGITQREAPIDPSKIQACGLPGMPENAVVHLVGIYRGKKELNIQLGDSGNATTEVEVIVDQTQAPVILILTAYDPVVWNVSYTPRANIAGVLVSGYHTQALLGLPKTMPHRVISYEQSNGCDSVYVYGKGELSRKQSKIRALVGKRVDVYHGESASSYFQIGGNQYVRPTDAVSSPDLSLDDYPVYRSEIPAGDKGIEELKRQGKIRLATAADVAAWQGDKDKKSRLERNLFSGKIYVVNEQITVPIGLCGAYRNDFIIPPNVPKPNGPINRCNFFYLKDHTSD